MAEEEDPYAVSSDSDDEARRKPPPKIQIEGRENDINQLVGPPLYPYLKPLLSEDISKFTNSKNHKDKITANGSQQIDCKSMNKSAAWMTE